MSLVGEHLPGVKLQPVERNADDRGFLTEILRADDRGFCQFEQAYIIHCHFGAVKAWYEHTITKDVFFCVQGTMKIGLVDLRRGLAENSYMSSAYVILGEEGSDARLWIPPGVAHGFTSLSRDGATILNLSSRSYDRENPDEIRHPWDDFWGPEFWKTEN